MAHATKQTEAEVSTTATAVNSNTESAPAVEAAEPTETQFAKEMSWLLQFADEHPDELAKRNFGPDKAAAMREALSGYREHRGEFLDQRGRRKQCTVDVNDATVATLVFRTELSQAFTLLGIDEGISSPAIPKRESLRANASRCLDWLTEIRPVVAEYDAALSGCISRPLATVEELIERLSSAVAAQQEASRELAPRRTALSESKERLERFAAMLRLAGRMAFRGQPLLLKRLHPKLGKVRLPAKVPAVSDKVA